MFLVLIFMVDHIMNLINKIHHEYKRKEHYICYYISELLNNLGLKSLEFRHTFGIEIPRAPMRTQRGRQLWH